MFGMTVLDALGLAVNGGAVALLGYVARLLFTGRLATAAELERARLTADAYRKAWETEVALHHETVLQLGRVLSVVPREVA